MINYISEAFPPTLATGPDMRTITITQPKSCISLWWIYLCLFVTIIVMMNNITVILSFPINIVSNIVQIRKGSFILSFWVSVYLGCLLCIYCQWRIGANYSDQLVFNLCVATFQTTSIKETHVVSNFTSSWSLSILESWTETELSIFTITVPQHHRIRAGIYPQTFILIMATIGTKLSSLPTSFTLSPSWS